MKITAHDIDLFAREPELPGLATVLNSQAIGDRIAERLGLDALRVRPDYVRLKPGVNCLVGYVFEASGIPKLGYAKAFSRGDRPKLLKAARKFSASQSGEPQTLLLDDIETLIHFFPNDARLESLSNLREWSLDGKLLPRMFEDDRDMRGATLAPIRYKPERRFVARLETATGEAYAVKFLTRSDFRHAKLAAKQVVRRSGVRAAMLVGNSDRQHILAFNWLKGDVLSRYIEEGGSISSVFDALGGMLVQFHTSRVRKLHTRSVESVVAALEAAIASTVHVMPELSAEAAEVLNRLSSDLREHWKSRQVPIHGDFYADQVLVDDGNVAIIDFDSAVFGQLESDAGNILAHLIYDALRGAMTGDIAASVRGRMIRAYRGYQLPMDERLLDLLTVASLILLLPRPFRARTEDWPEITRRILAFARDLGRDAHRGPEVIGSIETPSSSRAAGSGATSGAAGDDSSVLAAATDMARMNVLLTTMPWSSNHTSDGSLVVSSSIVKHRPGRRCLIAYQLADGQAVLGKLRVKGLDRRAWTLQRAFWNGEFGPTSADGVRVAEPLGEIPELNMWLQRRINAANGWIGLERGGGAGSAARVAHALCKLQRSGPLTERLHSPEKEIETLSEKLSVVAEERADLLLAISELEKGCRFAVRELPAREAVPAHRDFYPDNILMDETSVWLVDLDLYCMSHPALDAGNYIGHLWEAAVRRRIDENIVRDFENRFIDVLARELGRDLRFDIETFTVLTLARHVAISRRISDRRPFTRDILEAALERLSDLVHRNSVTKGVS
ncbi:MAG TPA: phosphotransferase [Rhodothermales bacterium]|nr:phosphotransferase [Rhodothermales bacterium]